MLIDDHPLDLPRLTRHQQYVFIPTDTMPQSFSHQTSNRFHAMNLPLVFQRLVKPNSLDFDIGFNCHRSIDAAAVGRCIAKQGWPSRHSSDPAVQHSETSDPKRRGDQGADCRRV